MQSFEPPMPGVDTSIAEYYLPWMGRVWLGMIAVIVVGITLWLASGRLHTVDVVMIAVLVLMRGGYYGLYGRHRQAMGEAGLEPFGPNSFGLLGEVLAHAIHPDRPARPR